MTPIDLFLLGRVDSSLRQADLYKDDPVWQRINERPPVKQIHNVYGVNLPTEFAYNLIEQSEGFVLDDDPSSTLEMEALITSPGFQYRQGIYYEDPKLGGMKASSGDGTVPLASLTYATTAWGAIDVEIPGLEHREMLKDPKFLAAVLDIVCADPKNA